jgi:hypothetical protein
LPGGFVEIRDSSVLQEILAFWTARMCLGVNPPVLCRRWIGRVGDTVVYGTFQLRRAPGGRLMPVPEGGRLKEGELDRTVRWLVYRHFIDTGLPPSTPMLVRETGTSQLAVEKSLGRLAAEHALVLAPGSFSIWMAHPFSALPTGYPVQVGQIQYWANCAWDALGIPAMLGTDSTTVTLCPDCGESCILRAEGDTIEPGESVVHFLVPAKHFWEDIGFT